MMGPWTWIVCLSLIVLAATFQFAPAEELIQAESALDGQNGQNVSTRLPLVITTWGFVEAARAAWKVVHQGGSSLDAVVEGCSTCERLRCDLSVGYGGSPDEAGETTLDAMIMDGVSDLQPSQLFGYKDSISSGAILEMDGQTTMNVGAVGALRSVKDAIRAARLVLDHSEHSLLVGDQASDFALSLGISGPTNLSTQDSLQMWSTWRDLNCQPNFRKDVIPDPRTFCGPYQPPADKQCKPEWLCRSGCWRDKEEAVRTGQYEDLSAFKGIGTSNHDTISMAVIDRGRKIAVGTSTNGASHKIPGRVGDGPIPGAAAYADDDVGACGATGDGDVMLRFAPCYQVVESMRRGKSPKHAARDAIERIKRKYPRFVGAVFAVNRNGKHAGACSGWTFQYAVRGNGMDDVEIHTISPDRSFISHTKNF